MGDVSGLSPFTFKFEYLTQCEFREALDTWLFNCSQHTARGLKRSRYAVIYGLYGIRNPDVECYRVVYIWVESERGGVGWSPSGFYSFGGGGQFFSGQFPRKFKYYGMSLEFSAQAQSIAILFKQTGWTKQTGRVCGHV